MVLTNEQVAELTDHRRVPTLYRVHEQPAPERIERLLQQLAALEIPAPALPEHYRPARPARSPSRPTTWWPAKRRAARERA